jgi:hypothetical protein
VFTKRVQTKKFYPPVTAASRWSATITMSAYCDRSAPHTQQVDFCLAVSTSIGSRRGMVCKDSTYVFYLNAQNEPIYSAAT